MRSRFSRRALLVLLVAVARGGQAGRRRRPGARAGRSGHGQM